MNSLLTAVATVVVPLLALLVPGIAFIPLYRRLPAIETLARIILWSVASLTLTTLIAAVFGVPGHTAAAGLLVMMAVLGWYAREHLRASIGWRPLAIAVALLTLAYSIFAIPLFSLHRGLPTGDIQKTIIWANVVRETNQLPDYTRAITTLNRDPVDFFTPGLHTLTALIMQVTDGALLATSLFAIAISLAVVVIAAALAHLIAADRLTRLTLPLITAGLLLTHFRFLRYLREPGYHFQNVVGELLLFGSLLVALSLIRRWRWLDAVLLALLLLSLAASHQFSAFLAAFILTPALLLLLVRLGRSHIKTKAHLGWMGVAIALLLAVGIRAQLHHKIPHIFTTTPHLANLLPTMVDYFRLMGPVWLTLGLAGLLLLLIYQRAKRRSEVALYIIATGLLLLLSQGPRLFIDIPPVRALLYTAVPLSICGAYTLITIPRVLRRSQSLTVAVITAGLLGVMVVSASISSVTTAYTLDHQVRTNSTLTGKQYILAESLKIQPGTNAVLVDDYNRRSTSWLVLSNRPMYTRIAADLERQMNEARQSPLRYQLYLNQLIYEKVFALGSLPLAATLMQEHAIDFVTGVANSSDTAFAANPALYPISEADNVALYSARPRPTYLCQAEQALPADTAAWLVRASTLVNDIGDREDTFEHLPVSLRTAQLNNPQRDKSCTWRSTTARLIPIRFNIGDYVRVLWDQDQTEQPDIDLELLIHFAAAPPETLTLRTVTGQEYNIANQHTVLRIPANHVPLDEKGFVTLFLHNPDQLLVPIDLIALGLARTP